MDDKDIVEYDMIDNLDDIPADVFKAAELEEGAGDSTATRVVYNSTPILNQSLLTETRNACGAFSMSKLINEMNFVEGVYAQNNCDPVKFWTRTCEKYGGTQAGGSAMMGNMKNALDSGFVSGYYLCKNVEEVIDAIDKVILVYTGSKFFDRKATYAAKDNILRFGKYSGGHLICVTGYDKDKKVLIMPNSRGDHRFDKGVNYLRFEDFDKMFSMIAMIDMKDSNLVEKVKTDRELLDKAKKDGLWNGDREDGQVIYGEMDIMLGRKGRYVLPIGIPYTRPLTRSQVATIIKETTKTSKTIWNGSNPDAPCTRKMAVLMIMRS